jgi:hypothetical protein
VEWVLVADYKQFIVLFAEVNLNFRSIISQQNYRYPMLHPSLNSSQYDLSRII